MSRRILQICPHDITPFGELCARYETAAASLGVQMTTVFLAPAAGAPLAFADYLDCEDLAATRAVSAALGRYAAHPWDLVLCHRYRAYWAVVRSPLARNFCTAVAHEFGLMARWQRRLNRRLAGRRVCFAGVSPGVAAELNRGAGDAVVLPNVLDVERAEAELLTRDQALAALGLQPGPLTVGVVGRLHYKKRPTLALQAFQSFAGQHAGARLVFVGDGEERARLIGRNLSGVHLLGNVPGAPKLFRAFDVLLHTTQVEAFGMVVLEAMFAGVPVVTLRQGGPAYVLGELGVYPAADTAEGFAAALVAAAAVDREELQAAGHSRVRQHFSIAALARGLDHLLQTGAPA